MSKNKILKVKKDGNKMEVVGLEGKVNKTNSFDTLFVKWKRVHCWLWWVSMKRGGWG